MLLKWLIWFYKRVNVLDVSEIFEALKDLLFQMRRSHELMENKDSFFHYWIFIEYSFLQEFDVKTSQLIQIEAWSEWTGKLCISLDFPLFYNWVLQRTDILIEYFFNTISMPLNLLQKLEFLLQNWDWLVIFLLQALVNHHTIWDYLDGFPHFTIGSYFLNRCLQTKVIIVIQINQSIFPFKSNFFIHHFFKQFL